MNRRWTQEFDAISNAFEAINLSEKEKTDLFTTVAAILHLGNVQFLDGGGDYAVLESAEGVSLIAEVRNNHQNLRQNEFFCLNMDD